MSEQTEAAATAATDTADAVDDVDDVVDIDIPVVDDSAGDSRRQMDTMVVESESEARAMINWLSLPPLHGPGCGCIQCVLSRSSMSQEELEEVSRMRKTVTVATRTNLAADRQPELWVGIGIPRDKVLNQLNVMGIDDGNGGAVQVLEVAVKVVGKEANTPETLADTDGEHLMALFQQGLYIGYAPTLGTYLVGGIPDLLANGVVLPDKVWVARQVEHWLPIDQVAGKVKFETIGKDGSSRRVKVTNEKTENGGVAVKEKAVKEQSACACGCGTMTGSKFAMGHDSKLRGMIHKVLDGTSPVGIIPQIAFDKCGKVKVQRWTGSKLEPVEVPDCHFDHDKGQKAANDYADKAEKKAKADAAEKAEKEAAKNAPKTEAPVA